MLGGWSSGKPKETARQHNWLAEVRVGGTMRKQSWAALLEAEREV